ncbi:MAG: Holliday junction resolvase RuvX [Bacteroidales bacterium]
MGRIIAIDYGNKRTGLAVTDPGQRIASPLETVPTHTLMHFLEAYFREEQVESVVVGRPFRLDHTEAEIVKQIGFFVQAFRKRFPGIPVSWMDERFTSKMASQTLRDGGMKKHARRERGTLDKVSASLILQTYLEKRNNMKR